MRTVQSIEIDPLSPDFIDEWLARCEPPGVAPPDEDEDDYGIDEETENEIDLYEEHMERAA